MAKRLHVATAALAAAMLLSACGDAPKSESKATSEYGNSVELKEGFDQDATFTFGYTAFPPSWDPTQSTSSADRIFFIPVYDGLFMEGPDGPEPSLALDYEPSEDGLSVTMKLREGLSFSDGTAFNAEAAKFNLDRNRAQGSRLAGELIMVTSVDVVDEMTIKVTTSGGVGALKAALAARAGMMVSPAAVASGALQNAPVGIGPYQTTAISPGVEATYERTPNYWDPKAQNVAKRVHKFIADDQTRYNALISGELDGAQINPDQVAAGQDAGLQIVIEPSNLFLYFGVNTQSEPFGNVEVRKALNMAIDREGIAQGLYDGHCTPQVQPFPEGGIGYSEKVGDGLDQYPYDPAKAKEMLEDAGVTSLTIDTVAPNVTLYTKFAEIVQANLKEVGITVNVKPMPTGQVVQEYMVDKTAPTISSVTTGILDPNMMWGSFVAPTASNNPGKQEYPELAKYAVEAATPIDPAERNAGYVKFMDEWMANPPHIVPVCTIHLAAAFNDKISGVAQYQTGLPQMRTVAKSK